MDHSTMRTVSDGAVGGFLGAAVMALWLLAIDAAAGKLAGSSVLLASNLGFQFLAFVLIGVAGALILEKGRRDPALLLALLAFVVAFEIFFVAVVMVLGPLAGEAPAWWKVFVGDVVATAAILSYVLQREPELAYNLAGEGADTAFVGALMHVTCPGTNQPAVIRLSKGIVRRCSIWPERAHCDRGCVAR
jgi:hypothetical protein